MLKILLSLLWMAFPFISMFIVLFAFWWPRDNMPWGRIAAMSFVSGILMTLYAACAHDTYDMIQALVL